MSEPRGEQLLHTRKHTGGEHLGAQRVVLQLLEVGLTIHILRISRGIPSVGDYCRGIKHTWR
jgi:hypothetical protein